MIESKLIFYLCRRAITDKFSGMVLGNFWPIVQPLFLILVYYFVFAHGLKVSGNGGTDYAPWLISGLLPWLFFNEGLMAVTTSLKNNSPLIKRLSVPAVYIHIASVAPAVFNHLVILLIYALISYLIWDYLVNPLLLLLVFFYVFFLVFFIGVILSIFYVYVSDTIQILQSVLNILFWITPIIWPSNIVSQKYNWILFYNPIYFIVEMYRKALVTNTPDFDLFNTTLIFPMILVIVISVPMYQNIKKINDYI